MEIVKTSVMKERGKRERRREKSRFVVSSVKKGEKNLRMNKIERKIRHGCVSVLVSLFVGL